MSIIEIKLYSCKNESIHCIFAMAVGKVIYTLCKFSIVEYALKSVEIENIS